METRGITNGCTVVALYDLVPETDAPNELTLAAGDELTVLDTYDEEGWWLARTSTGEEGFLPSNFVALFVHEPVEPEEPPPAVPVDPELDEVAQLLEKLPQDESIAMRQLRAAQDRPVSMLASLDVAPAKPPRKKTVQVAEASPKKRRRPPPPPVGKGRTRPKRDSHSVKIKIDGPMREGFLTKKSSFSRTWQVYYNTPQDKPAGTIPLKAMVVWEVHDASREHAFCIKDMASNTTYHVHASSKQEQMDWIYDLKKSAEMAVQAAQSTLAYKVRAKVAPPPQVVARQRAATVATTRARPPPAPVAAAPRQAGPLDKIVSVLEKLFIRRPARDDLRAAGIIQDRVFGTPLEELLQRYPVPRRIPVVVEKCIAFLRTNGLTVQGIFRIPGSVSRVQDLRVAFDEDEEAVDLDDAKWADVHSVAGVLKLYLRELPEPLLTYALYDDYIRVSKLDDPQEKIDLLHDTLKQIPQVNRFLLHHVAVFLSEVSAHERENRMGPSQLAIVFGPNILRPRVETMESTLLEMKNQIEVTELLIDEEWREQAFSDLL